MIGSINKPLRISISPQLLFDTSTITFSTWLAAAWAFFLLSFSVFMPSRPNSASLFRRPSSQNGGYAGQSIDAGSEPTLPVAPEAVGVGASEWGFSPAVPPDGQARQGSAMRGRHPSSSSVAGWYGGPAFSLVRSSLSFPHSNCYGAPWWQWH